MSSATAKRLRERWFGHLPKRWEVFHSLITQQIQPDMCVLDVGCGKASFFPFPWKSVPRTRFIGIDPDPEAACNPHMDEFHVLSDFDRWPVPDQSIDVSMASYVLEHVEKPESFFGNLRRVLRPGGCFLFLTPNCRHPAAIVSRLLPFSWKQRILAKTKGIADNDVFPTFYRMNTAARLTREAQRHGFQVEHLSAREYQPTGYLDFHVVGFLAACGYYHAVRMLGLEHWLAMSMIGVLRLPQETASLARAA